MPHFVKLTRVYGEGKVYLTPSDIRTMMEGSQGTLVFISYGLEEEDAIHVEETPEEVMDLIYAAEENARDDELTQDQLRSCHPSK